MRRLFDVVCRTCGYEEEDVLVRDLGPNREVGPCDCGGVVQAKFGNMALIGMKPTGEPVNVGLAVPLTTNADVRAYEAANPRTKLMHKGSREERQMRETLVAHGEKLAQKHGFSSMNARLAYTSAEHKKMRQAKGLER